jgi:sugar phosphate isomerase/epimerase
MNILISRFVTDPQMDLSDFKDSSMQVAFFQRKVFQEFDHELFYKRLIEHNIKIESIHAPAADIYHQKDNEFFNMLNIIKNIYKVKIITLHPQRGHRDQAREHFIRFEEEIKNTGLILAYETFEKEAINKKWISQLEDMHNYFDLLKFPFLGITYDFTHSTYEENIEEVTKYNEKIYIIHLSDALKDRPLDANEYHQHLPLGYGNYRVIEFLDLLIKIKYNHIIVLEYHPEYDALLKTDSHALTEYFNGNKNLLKNLIEERHKIKHTRDI